MCVLIFSTIFVGKVFIQITAERNVTQKKIVYWFLYTVPVVLVRL